MPPIHEPSGGVERVLALRSFPVFWDLSPQDLAVVAEHTTPHVFGAGAPLLRPGMPVRSLHFLLGGRVQILRDGKAHRDAVSPEIVGGLAALAQEPGGEHAVAAEDTLTLQLERDDMEDIFEDRFVIFLATLRAIARAQIGLRRGLGGDAGYPPPEKVRRSVDRPSARIPCAGAEPARAVADLDLVGRLFLLRRTMDFARARVEALADIAQESRVITLAVGEVLWRAGDVADHGLLLADGIVTCTSDRGDQRFGFGPGALMGGVDSVANERRWFDATAAEPVRGLRIETQRLLDTMEDNVELAMDVLRSFARGSLELEERSGTRIAF